MVFCKTVLGDCMLIPSLQEFELAIHDIDLQRLKEAEIMLNVMKATMGSGVTVKAYADRKEALRGAKYVINSILVGGYEHLQMDMDIPKKYGLQQTIGDTLGIGGIFRGLRTAQAMLGFAEDMREVCPDALFLNYTNPMSVLTHVMNTIGGIRTVGLCHSVQNCVPRLFKALSLPYENVSWKIAGINHMAWLLEVKRDGQDIYPEIKHRAAEKQAERHLDRIRFEIMLRFGYFVTESSHHSAEYYPYFETKSSGIS
jgi:alpha-galactosidase